LSLSFPGPGVGLASENEKAVRLTPQSSAIIVFCEVLLYNSCPFPFFFLPLPFFTTTYHEPRVHTPPFSFCRPSCPSFAFPFSQGLLQYLFRPLLSFPPKPCLPCHGGLKSVFVSPPPFRVAPGSLENASHCTYFFRPRDFQNRVSQQFPPPFLSLPHFGFFFSPR